MRTAAAELLAMLRAQGFNLSPEGDSIRVAPASRLTAELRGLIRPLKSELVKLLTTPRSEAEGLLDHLRRELARIERTWPGGRFPPVKANVVQIAVEVCESYARDHDLEAARGWDALALLRDAMPWALALAEGRGTSPPAEPIPAHEAKVCRWL